MKKSFKCPKCNYNWSYNYFIWVLKSPFHWIGIDPKYGYPRDYRKTKCPNCGEKWWTAGDK